MKHSYIKTEATKFHAESLQPLYVRFKELSEKAVNLNGSALTDAYRVYLEYERVRELVEACRRKYQNLLRVEYLSHG